MCLIQLLLKGTSASLLAATTVSTVGSNAPAVRMGSFAIFRLEPIPNPGFSRDEESIAVEARSLSGFLDLQYLSGRERPSLHPSTGEFSQMVRIP